MPRKITGTTIYRTGTSQSTDKELEIQRVCSRRKTPALFRALALFHQHETGAGVIEGPPPYPRWDVCFKGFVADSTTVT